jgi:hypothetical protein
MGTHEFIEQNKERILNIDGNADDGNITVEGDGGYLEFYYFENGAMVKAKTKRIKRRW